MPRASRPGRASRPHAARLGPARESSLLPSRSGGRLSGPARASRWCASRPASGRGPPATVRCWPWRATAASWAAGRRARASWLSDALAAPVWARYGSFRGQPPITATLRWTVAERSITLAGCRGSEPSAQTLGATPPTSARATGDTSPVTASRTAGPLPCERCASRSLKPPARRRATAPSAAARPSRAPRGVSAQAARPPRCLNAVSGARARCPRGAGSRRAIAANAAARPHRARLEPPRQRATSAQAVSSEQLRIQWSVRWATCGPRLLAWRRFRGEVLDALDTRFARLALKALGATSGALSGVGGSVTRATPKQGHLAGTATAARPVVSRQPPFEDIKDCEGPRQRKRRRCGPWRASAGVSASVVTEALIAA